MVEIIMEEGLPEGVTDTNQWYTLVSSWFTEKSKKMSKVNSANAKKKKLHHTAGRRSIARKAKLGRAPTRLEVFDVIHKRPDGTYINGYAKDFMRKPMKWMGIGRKFFSS